MAATEHYEHALTGKGPGYMSADIVACQFSVYPLRQEDVDGPVQAAMRAAREEGCTVRVANLSTLLTGSEDQVFSALRAAFRAAQRHGPAVMTATVAAGMPTDELVGEIQRELDAQSPLPAAVASQQGDPPDGGARGVGSRPADTPRGGASPRREASDRDLPGSSSPGQEGSDSHHGRGLAARRGSRGRHPQLLQG